MVRKFTLLVLLFIGINAAVQAQVLDAVSIEMPYGTDTTCPGEQLTFIATQSNDTFTHVQYHWYTNLTYTGVIIDTFYTTALVDGDSVYCWLVYHNSLGVLDSSRSNTIIIHRSSSFAPAVVISLMVGSNPDCAGHKLTFKAFPVNGGPGPQYQWLVNGLPVAGEDSVTFTRFFNHHDTVSVQMLSNSPCAAPFPLTDTSNYIVVSHDSLTAGINIMVTHNPICLGVNDTFTATTSSTGYGAYLSWYVDSVLIPTALGPLYHTTGLHNGDIVYCILHAPDACVVNHTTVSNPITMTVITPLITTVSDLISAGSNPGCLDSPVTFTGYYTNFGVAPSYDWYVNGVLVAHDTTKFTSTFQNGDVVTFKVRENDNGCYNHDSVTAPPFLMVRDSTPVTPWLSLHGDLLEANSGGLYLWYFNTVNSYTGTNLTLIPGANTETWNPHTLGYYFIVKDSSVSCHSAPSNILYISLVGVKSVNTTDVNIYPNPTTGILNIDWGSRIVNHMKLDVFNIVGQGMRHEEINNSSHFETDLSYLPEGNYIIVLRDEDGSKATYKIYIAK